MLKPVCCPKRIAISRKRKSHSNNRTTHGTDAQHCAHSGTPNFIAEYDFLEDKNNDSLFESLVVFKLALKESLPGYIYGLSVNVQYEHNKYIVCIVKYCAR
jgi:hypothetical protein